jgi:hypothetical protein
MRIAGKILLVIVAGFVASAPWRELSAQASHLPLEVGSRWELASGQQRMSLVVTERTGDGYVVRWDNPFISGVEFYFSASGNKILLNALNMGNGVAKQPGGTVYWDFDLPQGRSWNNNLGTSTIVSRGKSVSTPSGTYNDCIEIRLHAKDGADTYWTFAPRVGFVQFGQGRGAFLLTSHDNRGEDTVRTNSRPAPTFPNAPAPNPPVRGAAAAGLKPSSAVLIGLDSNPSANEGYTDNSKRNRFRMATDSGVNYVYLHPKWDEIEPRAGQYKWDEIDLFSGLADQSKLPVSVNLRIIDTNQRAMADSYKGWRWNDPRMAQKLKDALRAMAPHLRNRVKWIAIGNEVDAYFGNHKGEIGEYAQLIQSVLPTVRELFPGAGFTINFTYGAEGDINRLYGPLTNLVDLYSWTYYPLNGDFTFKSPNNASNDIARLVDSAGSKLVLIQEVGYASAPQVNSSEDIQAQFLQNVFDALRAHRDRIIAANFVWMSDLPDKVVNDLTAYYKAGNADKMKAFLGSLGYYKTNGQPKKAWAVFQREAGRM